MMCVCTCNKVCAHAYLRVFICAGMYACIRKSPAKYRNTVYSLGRKSCCYNCMTNVKISLASVRWFPALLDNCAGDGKLLELVLFGESLDINGKSNNEIPTGCDEIYRSI